MAEEKYVYFFGNGKAEGNGEMKQLLGGKGAGLAEMTRAKLPVPAGFTITTEVCQLYYSNNKKYPAGLEQSVKENLAKLEKSAGKKLGDPNDPLLVSVRSGAPVSMPGMMETILNLGLTDKSVEGLAKKTSNRRFALDAYRRFIMMYGSTAMGIDRMKFDDLFDEVKEKHTRGRLNIAASKKVGDTDVNEDELAEVITKFKALYKKEIKKDFPQDPIEQLWGAIGAVFNSWMAEKAVTYRRVENLVGIKGTAVNVMQMVFGNKGDTSGTGVCFTRDPNSGENIFYGDYLFNAQGEDVVAGIRTPIKLSEFEKEDKKAYDQLCKVRALLEDHYKDMQDMEFTVEEGKLYMLQCRTGKRSPAAAFRMAVDMVNEGLITKEEAIMRIKASDIEGIFYPAIDYKQANLKSALLVSGIAAVPGAAAGKICFSAAKAEELAAKKEKAILVRKETSPEDVGGMHAAQGILTATGGKTSHAAVVARGWGKCCIVGCEKLVIDYEKGECSYDGKVLKEGDFITLDGTKGDVYIGELKLVQAKQPESYKTLMKWVDETRTIKVRTNADQPEDAKVAIEHGAEGIGLCRTEHMFFDEERIPAIRRMIVADTEEERREALAALLPYQKSDFAGLYEVMQDRPVTIRLLDPPLHEFLPKTEEETRALSAQINVPYEKLIKAMTELHEFNPMLGLRGCRLAVIYPEIAEMQTRAIMEAAIEVKNSKGYDIVPEIMIPLTCIAKEMEYVKSIVEKTAQECKKEKNSDIKYSVGTMVETPRAALTADEIAESAEFFSFGTNDLTQMTFGFSRDDTGNLIRTYVDKGIFQDDIFRSIDQTGVGKLVDMACKLGRQTRSDIKLGICGEHGGDPRSIEFCHKVGLNYVSCSPFRVPVARVAAAQAAIKEKRDN